MGMPDTSQAFTCGRASRAGNRRQGRDNFSILSCGKVAGAKSFNSGSAVQEGRVFAKQPGELLLLGGEITRSSGKLSSMPEGVAAKNAFAVSNLIKDSYGLLRIAAANQDPSQEVIVIV